MKITTIRYRQLVSHKEGYGHDAIEAEASIDEGQTALEALNDLKAWVWTRLHDAEKVAKLVRTEEWLERRVAQLQNARDQLKTDIDAAKEVLGLHEKLLELAKEHGLEEAAKLEVAPDLVPF